MEDKMVAFHFDLKRAMWRWDYMHAVVDQLKGWGFNAIVYEIEDKFRFLNHPALVHPDAPPNEETSSFVQVCREKGVEVIPLLQSLGHAESVVGKPEYAHLRETPEVDSQYDPLSEEARDLIIEMYDEIIDVMQPAEFFHMGGDETWSLGKSEKCAAIVDEIGVGGLYLKHMMPIFEHIHSRGLRPVIWADIVLSRPEMIDRVPEYVVMMDWDYSTGTERPESIMVWGVSKEGHNLHLNWEAYQDADIPRFRKHLERYAVDEQTHRDGTFRQFYCTDALRGMGFDVITGSACRCSGDMAGTPFQSRHLPNCFYFARKGVECGSGTLVTCWAVRHDHPELCMTGAFAAALALRTEGPYDAEAFGLAYSADVYGVEMPELAGAMLDAEPAFYLGEANGLYDARRALAEGRDPIPGMVENLEKVHGGHDEAVSYIKRAASGYARARDVFLGMKEKAKRNTRNIDFWIEGMDFNILSADIMLAALGERLEEEAARLLDRIAAARETTRELFSETYTSQGVEDELDLRYGFHEEYLKGLVS